MSKLIHKPIENMLQNKLIKIKRMSEEGFTLIELLVVIGILAILMGIVLIAINPAHQFALANDTNRRNAVAQILSAVGQYEAEHAGALPPSIAGVTTATEISNAGANLCTDLVAGSTQYIPSFPEDPNINNGTDITSCTTYDSGYQVAVDASKRVTISAPNTQVGSIISVTR